MGRVRYYNRKITIESEGIRVSTWGNKTIRGELWLVFGTVNDNHFVWPTNEDELPIFMTREPTLDEMQTFLDYLGADPKDAVYPKMPPEYDLA